MNDFLTWHPGAYGDLDFEQCSVPTDPCTRICSVRSYLAQAMLMWYDTTIREKNTQAWDRLQAAWKATFHTELAAGALETWPTDGPHGFSESQSDWLASTLRHLKGQGRAPPRRRAAAAPRVASPAPPPAAKAAARTTARAGRGGGASRTARNPDPVQSTRRLATFLKFNIISIISLILIYSIMSIISIIFHYDSII